MAECPSRTSPCDHTAAADERQCSSCSDSEKPALWPLAGSREGGPSSRARHRLAHYYPSHVCVQHPLIEPHATLELGRISRTALRARQATAARMWLPALPSHGLGPGWADHETSWAVPPEDVPEDVSTDCLCEYQGRASRDILRGPARSAAHSPARSAASGPAYSAARGPARRSGS